MEEDYVSKTSVIAYTLWALVAVLMGAAWTLSLVAPDRWHTCVLLACSACGTSALAATAHIKNYAQRMCALIRATKGLMPTDGSLRSLR